MSNYPAEHEREYPTRKYDHDAYDRLYGNRDIINSDTPYPFSNMDTAERAKHLIEHGYIDDTVSLKTVIARLEKIDREAKQNENRQDENSS